MYANHNSFIDNVFTSNMAGGAIMFSRGIVFHGNEFAHNRSTASGYGLLFKDVDDVEMVDNQVHHNRIGITLEGAPLTPGASVRLRSNFVGYNDTALQLATTTGAVLAGNAFTGNLEQVTITGGSVEHRNTWVEDGRGNYWDEYAGYDADGNGVGDLPYRYEGALDELVRRNEWVRLYSFTPAHSALELAGRWFPGFRPPPRVVDPAPLLAAPVGLSDGVVAAGRGQALWTGSALLALFAVAWWQTRSSRRPTW
jgi:nitrous oxidase accessory protein